MRARASSFPEGSSKKMAAVAVAVAVAAAANK